MWYTQSKWAVSSPNTCLMPAAMLGQISEHDEGAHFSSA